MELLSFLGSLLLSSHFMPHAAAISTAPIWTPSPDENFTAQYVLEIDKSCNSGQSRAITDAFDEMVTMIGGSPPGVNDGPNRSWLPDVDWKSALAIQYFGPAEKTLPHREEIFANLNRAAATVRHWPIFFWDTRYKVTCDDPAKQCPCEGGIDVLAYTINNEPHVNFCPMFFGLGTLQDILIGNGKKNTWERGLVEGYMNRAVVWAHELMHNSYVGWGIHSNTISDQPVTNWPQIPFNAHDGVYTLAYGNTFAQYLSQSDSIAGGIAADNADNYAWYFMANYVNKILGFVPTYVQLGLDPEEPPLGWEPSPPRGQSASGDQSTTINTPVQVQSCANELANYGQIPTHSHSPFPTSNPSASKSLPPATTIVPPTSTNLPPATTIVATNPSGTFTMIS